MNEDNGFKSYFLRGVVIVIVAIVFLVIGGAATVGILSAVNKVTPSELVKGDITEEKQPEPGNLEEEEPGSEEKGAGNVISEEGKVLDDEDENKSSSGLLLGDFNNEISKIVEKITPSVVNISVTFRVQDIFGQVYEQEGIGSGVIYSEDGYIITNSHVAAGANKLSVTLYDGSEYPATLIGADENTDVAVIKIEADNLKAASFGSIDNVRVGDVVIAVGSPFGLQQTITMGVISAKGRDIQVSQETLPLVNLIQTDAAINSGNSGGPLVSSKGRVIGINTLIVSPSGTSAGIGFAIPADTVVNIAGQIIKYGKARIPYLGIEMGDNKTGIQGVYITDVLKGYPADKAGIKKGDVITEFNGVKVQNPLELIAQILRLNVGDSVNVKIYRDGQYIDVKLELVESPLTENIK
ncbi:MAG: trypsin-like peptidase domain-containing protein [Actinomycetota bacterium]|nr:trypsin-like peptidase domain-containing protein [Actinomycetota bacterium]